MCLVQHAEHCVLLQLGATCTLSTAAEVTHVVAGGDHTDKVHWGRQRSLHVVSPAWLHESGMEAYLPLWRLCSFHSVQVHVLVKPWPKLYLTHVVAVAGDCSVSQVSFLGSGGHISHACQHNLSAFRPGMAAST